MTITPRSVRASHAAALAVGLSTCAGTALASTPEGGAASTSSVAQAPAIIIAGSTASVSLDVMVRAERAARAASDWTLDVGFQPSGPPAGASGAELLRRAPGFHISQHSGEGKAHQIFLRGFDAVHGQDTEITAGGVPVNEVSNIHGQGYADLHFLIPEVVRRLRVVEGPYDAQQGDFAVAGSIDFDLGFTERGLFGRTSAGQFGLVRALVAFAPENTSDETFAAGEFARGDGFGPSRAWSRASAIAQLQRDLSDHFALRVLAQSYAGRFDSAGVVPLDDIEAGRIDRFATTDPRQGGASARHSALFELLHHDQGSTTALSVSAVLRDLRLRQDFTGFLLSAEGDLTEQTHDATTFSGRATHRRHFLERRVATEVGATFRFDRVEQVQRRLRVVDGKPQAAMPSAAGSIDGTELQDDVSAELALSDLGLFGDAQLRFGDFAVRGGLRGEAQAFAIFDRRAGGGRGDRRDAFGSILAPRATVEYSPFLPLRFFASYGQGFRSPQALDLAQGERSTFTRVHSGEIGARAHAFDGVTTSLVGFVTHVGEDLVFDPTSGRTTPFGPTTRTGGTLFLEASPHPAIQAALGGTLVRAVHADTGALVPFVPPLVLRLDVSAAEQFGVVFGVPWGLFGSLGATALGPRPLPFSERADPVFWAEAAAGIEVGVVSLSVEIFNVLGARWNDGEFVYASRFDPEAATSLVPRRHVTAGRPFSAQATLTVHL